MSAPEEPWDADKVAREAADAVRAKEAAAAREGREKPYEFGVSSDPDPITVPLPDKLSWKYDPIYAERAQKAAALGATYTDIAFMLGISRSTFTEWRHTHPEFAEAVKVGAEPADDRMVASFYQRGTGYDVEEEQAIKIKVGKDLERVEVVKVMRHVPGDTQAAWRWLANRRPDDWKDRREVQMTGVVAHYTIDEARRELARFFAEGMEAIDLTALPAPDTATPEDMSEEF